MQLLQIKGKFDYSMTNPLNPTPKKHPKCPKIHTGVKETEKDRDVMNALTGGDTILWGEEVRRRKAISDQGDNMNKEGMESRDTVGVSFHYLQFDLKCKAGSKERPGRNGTRG